MATACINAVEFPSWKYRGHSLCFFSLKMASLNRVIVQALSGAFKLLSMHHVLYLVAYEEFLSYAVITEEARGDLG